MFFKEYDFLLKYILRDSIFSKRTFSDKILLNEKEKCFSERGQSKHYSITFFQKYFLSASTKTGKSGVQ
jgi:hypothetical protein